ncbi:MAG: molybdate ABC transporter permease subunit [Bacteroidota bacterium]
MDFEPLYLTFKLALVTTAILFVLALPLAYWLSGTRSKFKPIIEALVTMPLVLPPTVLGFYFLVALSPRSPFGQWLSESLGLQLVFSFKGLVLASIIYSLPFMVQPIQAGFSALPKSLKEAAQLMGKSQWVILKDILLPNIKPALWTGVVLAFAHTIGEFGVVLMIGGNIPGETRVASIAIYDSVEALDYASANTYSLVLFAITFSILLTVYVLNGGYLKSLRK